jgi:hypothetical protein
MDKGIQDPIDLWLEEDFGPTDEEIAAGAAIHKAFEEALAEEAAGAGMPVTGPDVCLETNPIPCYQVSKYSYGQLEKQEDGTLWRVDATKETIEERKRGSPVVFGNVNNNWKDRGPMDAPGPVKYIVLHNTAGPCVDQQYIGKANSWNSKGYDNQAWQSLYEVYIDGLFPPEACAGSGVMWSPSTPEGKCPHYKGWHYGVDQNGNIAQGCLDQDECNHAGGGMNKNSIGIELNGDPRPTVADFQSVEDWAILWDPAGGDEKTAFKAIDKIAKSDWISRKVRAQYKGTNTGQATVGKYCNKFETKSGNYNFGRPGMYNDTMLDAAAKLVHDLCMKYSIPIQKGKDPKLAKGETPGIMGHDETKDGMSNTGCATDPYACKKKDPGTRLRLVPGVGELTPSGNGYVGAAFDWDDFLDRVKSYGTEGPALAQMGAATDEETSEA